MGKKRLSEIMDYYQNNELFFKTPENLIIGKGNQSRFIVPRGNISEMKREMKRCQAQCNESIMVGVIPFDAEDHAIIVIPEQVEIYDQSDLNDDLTVDEFIVKVLDCQTIPNQEEFRDMVQTAIDCIDDCQLDKVVLARTLAYTLEDEPELSLWLTHLAQRNKKGYIFSIPTNERETLIGASPELLIRKKGKMVTINPLAGSRKRTFNQKMDEKLEFELLHSEKDLYEHQIVVDFMIERLQPYLKHANFNEKPVTLYTDSMIHLSTVTKGELESNAMTSLDLALLLHPTPAICGAPKQQAFDLIQKVEPFQRDYYSGAVGYMDQHGDGEWVVTIRCAMLHNHNVTLYAGAGIVSSSSPEKEFDETAAKFTTMLDAMGLKEYH